MILLDTHVVIWMMTEPERISRPAAEAIARAVERGARPALSAASLFELFYLKRCGRLRMHVPDNEVTSSLCRWFDFLPITEDIATQAALLPDSFHGDPMDRFIAATALGHNLTLVTRDERIRVSGLCLTLW